MDDNISECIAVSPARMELSPLVVESVPFWRPSEGSSDLSTLMERFCGVGFVESSINGFGSCFVAVVGDEFEIFRETDIGNDFVREIIGKVTVIKLSFFVREMGSAIGLGCTEFIELVDHPLDFVVDNDFVTLDCFLRVCIGQHSSLAGVFIFVLNICNVSVSAGYDGIKVLLQDRSSVTKDILNRSSISERKRVWANSDDRMLVMCLLNHDVSFMHIRYPPTVSGRTKTPYM